jgi:ATP-binding cassette subfamily B multidrug efflux pump
MGKILKNLAPYWKSVILIIALLFIQAFCDLSLPAYTSDIIDVGIQNNGISHTLPKSITTEEYNTAEIFMNDSEKKIWEESYKTDGKIYKLKNSAIKKWDSLDKKLRVPLLLNYEMSHISKSQLKSIEASFSKNTGTAASGAAGAGTSGAASSGAAGAGTSGTAGSNAGNAAMAKAFSSLKSVDGYTDIRPLFLQMAKMGQLPSDTISSSRKQVEKTLDTMGETLASSMGVAYAVARDKQAGMDMDAIQTSYLIQKGLQMVLLALLQAVMAILVGFFASRVGAGVGRNLRDKVFTNVISFSGTEMDRFSTASLITRSTNDVQQVQLVVTLLLRMIAYAPILGIGGLIQVAYTGAGMEWVIALAIVVILGVVGFLMAIAMPKFKLMQKLVDRVNLVSREILTGILVIRAFGREKKEEERFDDANVALTKTTLFTNRVMTFMMPIMMLIMNGLSILIVWVAGHRINDGVMQVGAMTAFITYAMMIVMSFLMLTMLSIMLPRAAVASERIDEVISMKSSISETGAPETVSPEEKSGVVSFNHVDFRYPGGKTDALTDIDFTARPGETTAIIGSTGCGKSTLVSLIPRLYDVTGGSITLDGHDIRNITLGELRNRIGFVPQKGNLFSGTIATNLRFGNESASDEDLREAIEIAQATDFVADKPEGIDSPISQGGTNVSGGQKQRLSIARAIAKNPDIYVFDDSFSALDLKTDASLRHALSEKVKDKTVIIVAQRISTILHADQILVLDDGNLVGKGTHAELMETCEVYQQIATSQLSAAELEKESKGGYRV